MKLEGYASYNASFSWLFINAWALTVALVRYPHMQSSVGSFVSYTTQIYLNITWETFAKSKSWWHTLALHVFYASFHVNISRSNATFSKYGINVVSKSSILNTSTQSFLSLIIILGCFIFCYWIRNDWRAGPHKFKRHQRCQSLCWIEQRRSQNFLKQNKIFLSWLKIARSCTNL